MAPRNQRSAVRRTSSSWFQPAVLAVVACLAVLGANLALSELHPGNVWGLSYGAAAAFFLLALAAFGARRRTMKVSSRLRLGRSRTWLAFHLYGGVLFLLLMLMHAGFGLPSGWVTGWLWALSLWTVASGVIGRVLQKWIPRILASGLDTEVLYERIPELVAEIGKRAAAIAESSEDEAIRALHDRKVAPTLVRPRWRWIYFLDVTGGIQSRLKEFGFLRPLLADDDQGKLDELERLYRTKLEIDAHYTLQQPLRWWLYLHLPTSILLIVFLVLHLYTVFFY